MRSGKFFRQKTDRAETGEVSRRDSKNEGYLKKGKIEACLKILGAYDQESQRVFGCEKNNQP
jgi:hypothetical protein